MASAKGGSVPSGVGYGEGCPLSSRLKGLGSVVSSPSGVRGRAPAENGFWRILKATERSFLYLNDKIWGTICISVPRSKFWGGTCPPCPPVIYAHVSTKNAEAQTVRQQQLPNVAAQQCTTPYSLRHHVTPAVVN